MIIGAKEPTRYADAGRLAIVALAPSLSHKAA
jgi:hypothetical protein